MSEDKPNPEARAYAASIPYASYNEVYGVPTYTFNIKPEIMDKINKMINKIDALEKRVSDLEDNLKNNYFDRKTSMHNFYRGMDRTKG